MTFLERMGVGVSGVPEKEVDFEHGRVDLG